MCEHNDFVSSKLGYKYSFPLLMALYKNNNKVSEDFEYSITKVDWSNQPKIINDYKIHADKRIFLQLDEATYRLL